MSIAGRLEIIDIFFLVLLLRVSYIAVSRGLFREICKITGLLCAVFFAFQFYPHLSEAIRAKTRFINPGYLYPVVFLLIFAGVVAAFFFLNLFLGLFLPKGDISVKRKLILLGLGGFRAVFFLSVLIFLFHLASFNPKHIQNGLSYRLAKKVAPVFYLAVAGPAEKIIDRDFKLNNKVEDYLREVK